MTWRTLTRRTERGESLITLLVAVAVFVIIALAAYASIVALIRGTGEYREETVITALADQWLEIARNLPYSEIGTMSGNPHGTLPDLPNAKTVVVNGISYDIYYDVTYVDDPADGTIASGTDPAPDDYKQVKLSVKNDTTGVITPFVTNIVPKGLEGLESGGALSIEVFDADGLPVPNATVEITNSALSPALDLIRTTDSNGDWIEVGLPDSVSSYHIVASKSGYSTDQTYPSSGGNPNPVKPDETISNGQVTQVSFAIDQTSSLVFNTENETCQPLSGVGLELQGSKLIGTSPNVLKFDHSYTSDGNGEINLPTLEWDTYKPIITTASYMVYGSSPIQQISVLPDTNEVSTLILGPATPYSLLVIVKDASTGQPIENASVSLSSTSTGYTATEYTEGSVWSQQDWSSGSGQASYIQPNEYWADDGNVDVTTLPIGVRLLDFAGQYEPSGTLESSTFDTGTASTSYTSLTWQPTSQTASTSVAFQLATNNDDATWNYLGPDGTSATYYTVPGTTVNATTTRQRYVRYKVFLSTTSTTTTPVLSSVSLNYISGCASPGQSMFAGLSSGNYQLTVSAAGYQTQVIPVQITGYTTLEVDLSN